MRVSKISAEALTRFAEAMPPLIRGVRLPPFASGMLTAASPSMMREAIFSAPVSLRGGALPPKQS